MEPGDVMVPGDGGRLLEYLTCMFHIQVLCNQLYATCKTVKVITIQDLPRIHFAFACQRDNFIKSASSLRSLINTRTASWISLGLISTVLFVSDMQRSSAVRYICVAKIDIIS